MQKLLTIILLIVVAFSAEPAQKRRKAAKPKRKVERVKQLSRNHSNKYADYDGIDVSSYQKDIDWERVCADKKIKFVYIKATEGATYTSPHFEFNIKNARKHGLKVGSYHFLRTTSSLRSQFENFIKSARPEEQDLVPLIDFENRGTWTGKQIADSLEAFARMVRKHYRCRPMIYTMTSFYNKYLAGNISDYPLFIARYSESAPQLNDGAKYSLWQYTDQGKVEGIDHDVDLCRFAPGVKLADILLKPHATKLSKYDSVAPEDSKPATPDKFKSQDHKKAEPATPKLSKKEQEQLLKEQKKEEKRRRKLMEKARKDSIALAKKLEKACRDSIKKAKKAAEKLAKKTQPSVKAADEASSQPDTEYSENEVSAAEQHKAVATSENNEVRTEKKKKINANQGATYKKHYSTRSSRRK